MGTVRKLPSGRFRWEIMIEGRRFSGMALSKTLAQQALAGLIADATRGGVADPSSVTVTEYITQWLEGRKTSRAYRTHEVQERALRLYIKPAIGDKRLQKLSPADLRGLFDGLNKKDLGAASQRQVHQLLLTSLKHALQVEIVTRNVAEIVRPNPPRQREREELAAFTPDEAALFLAACRADPSDAWFEFALGTGMRRGEVCGLKWTDLNLKTGTIAVRETVSDTGGTIRISALGRFGPGVHEPARRHSAAQQPAPGHDPAVSGGRRALPTHSRAEAHLRFTELAARHPGGSGQQTARPQHRRLHAQPVPNGLSGRT